MSVQGTLVECRRTGYSSGNLGFVTGYTGADVGVQDTLVDMLVYRIL